MTDKETRKNTVIVWSSVVGYMRVTCDNGYVYDELGHRPDLETPENTQLIQMQLEG